MISSGVWQLKTLALKVWKISEEHRQILDSKIKKGIKYQAITLNVNWKHVFIDLWIIDSGPIWNIVCII